MGIHYFLDLFLSSYLQKQVDTHAKSGSDVATEDDPHTPRVCKKVWIT